VSGLEAKHLQVESPDPSEGDCEDGNMLEPQLITWLPPESTVAQHPTKIIMHPELIKTGDAENRSL